MGDLHRREGDHWVPTTATTETSIDLDGVPVRVSWLVGRCAFGVGNGRRLRLTMFRLWLMLLALSCGSVSWCRRVGNATRSGQRG